MKNPAAVGVPADDELAQIRQWYADPVRDLPRKVVADVDRLLKIVEANDAEIAREQAKRQTAERRAWQSRERMEAAEARVAQLEAALREMVCSSCRDRSHLLDCLNGSMTCDDARCGLAVGAP
jgi:hypothetical protein